MQISKGIWAIGLVSAVGAIWLWAFGCERRSAMSWPEPEPPTDYRVWFWSGEYNNRLFAYHPVGRKVDTVDISYFPRNGVTVSADGTRLYLAQQSSVVVLDTDSLSVIAELPYHTNTPVAVSPDNELIAVVGDDLNILRTSDYSVVFSDTSGVWQGRFSTDSKTFYCLSNGIYRVDLTDTNYPVVRTPITGRTVTKIIPSNDESRWLMYETLPSYWTFAVEVYDVLMDSIIYRHVLQPGGGNLEITPDGKYAFYTNPGTLHYGPDPESAIYVFDIEANEIDRVITTDKWVDSVTPPIFLPYAMAVTPDNRWLIATSILWSHGQLLLYDLKSASLVDYVEFENDGWGWNISVQIIR